MPSAGDGEPAAEGGAAVDQLASQLNGLDVKTNGDVEDEDEEADEAAAGR